MPRRDGSSGHFSVFLSREGIGNTAQFVGSVGDAFSAICCLQIFRFTSSKPSKSAIASDEKFIRLRTNSFVRYCPCNPPPASFAQHIGQGAAVYAEVTTPSIIRSSGEGERSFSQRSGLSPSVSPTKSFWEGARGRGTFYRKSPPSQSSRCFSSMTFQGGG